MKCCLPDTSLDVFFRPEGLQDFCRGYKSFDVYETYFNGTKRNRESSFEILKRILLSLETLQKLPNVCDNQAILLVRF